MGDKRPSIESLKSYPGGSAQRTYLEAIREQIAPAEQATHAALLATARAAFGDADVDRAFELSIKLPPSFDRAALLLRCARDMGTLAAAQAAIASLETLSERDQKRVDQHIVLGRIRDDLALLSANNSAGAPEATIAHDIPRDWIAWLRRLTAAEPWKAAVSVAEAAGAGNGLSKDFLKILLTFRRSPICFLRRGRNGGSWRFRMRFHFSLSFVNAQRAIRG